MFPVVIRCATLLPTEVAHACTRQVAEHLADQLAQSYTQNLGCRGYGRRIKVGVSVAFFTGKLRRGCDRKIHFENLSSKVPITFGSEGTDWSKVRVSSLGAAPY